MQVMEIIQKYYKKNTKSYHFLVVHSIAVAQKALEIAKNVPDLKPDFTFIFEAALLHDIGIFLTNAPEIDCFGKMPYVSHGYLGRTILEEEGLFKHALVCERHIGMGLSIKDIQEQELFLFPKRDMIPKSIEEEIICLADKFFTKQEGLLTKEKSLDSIKKSLLKFGEDKVERFSYLLKKFRIESS